MPNESIPKTNIRHAAIIPLIGGFPLAATSVTGNIPEAIFSWEPFFNNDKIYLRYLAKHEKFPPYFQIDDERVDNSQYKFYKDLDFIYGTPPCAGLSMSGNLKAGARENSPVNDWIYAAAEFVLEVLQPKVYVFENAPNLYTNIGKTVRANLMKIAEKHGYAGTFYKTDTLLHGIPQRRPRTYTILVKGEVAPILEFERAETPSVEEYLKEIPEKASLQNMWPTIEPYIEDFEIVRFLKSKFGNKWRQEFLDEKEHLTSYDFLTRKNLLLEYQKFVLADPDSHPSSIKDINHVIKKVNMGKNYRLSHRVLCVDKHHVYAVIGEMMQRNIHPTEDRRLNMREYIHLMGMPHDFEIESKKEIGKLPQNVPVKTSEFIIKEIIEIINGNRNFFKDRFAFQNNIKPVHIKNKQLF